jgi:hypothetical protein
VHRSLEMIQQKHAFLIETESVRRMLYAKPSMNPIVVQLLVDLCSLRSRRSRRQTKNFCETGNIRRENLTHDSHLRRALIKVEPTPANP